MTQVTAPSVEAAYARCEAITTEQARNFSYGIKLLPPQKRRALSAVYAFARRVDDIGDSDAPAEQRIAGLAKVRADLHRLDEPGDDPVLIALGHAARTTGMPLSAFDDLITGCEADVRGTHYETFEDLKYYCYCVASTIGRLSLAVFGTTDLATAQPIADSLGLALQLTNILRDIVEDRGNGRIYLPKEDLDRFGVTLDLDEHGTLADDETDLVALIEFEAARARRDLRRRPAPAADARPPQPRVLRCDGRASTTGCSAGSWPGRGWCSAAGFRCLAGKKPSSLAAASREPHRERSMRSEPTGTGSVHGVAERWRGRTVKHVIVIGGGLAGLAAATKLASDDTKVTVLEARARLGGATFSFDRDGLTVDNGQHVLLRCYTEYLDFLATIGVRDQIDLQDRFRIPVVHANGRHGELYRTGLPAPLHLGAALSRYGMLSIADRARVGIAVAKLRTLNPADPRLDERSFGSWLAQYGQRKDAIDALWNLVCIAALNTDADDASLALCAMVFRTALLDRADAADIGVPRIPLGELHGDPAAAYLKSKGADVRLRTAARAVRAVGSGYEVDIDDETLTADAVVVAVPSDAVSSVLPDGALAEPEAPAKLGSAPIVNVHAVYDRKVTEHSFVAIVGSSGAVGVRPHRHLPRAERAVPGRVALGGGGVDRRAGVPAQRGVPAGTGQAVPAGGAGTLYGVLRHQGTQGDLPPGTGQRPVAAEGADPAPRLCSRRCVDRHRLARHDGGCGAKRKRSCSDREGAPGARCVGECRMTATMPAEVTAARDVVEPALRKAVDELTPAMRRIARYHFGWADEHGNDTPGNSGKALRPALTLLSAQAISPGPEPCRARRRRGRTGAQLLAAARRRDGRRRRAPPPADRVARFRCASGDPGR